MLNIAHLNIVCQDPDEIPFIAGERYDHTDLAPSATPLADLLAASYRDGQTDAEGADAAVMSYEVWLETVGPWTFEPEPSYFEEYEVRS